MALRDAFNPAHNWSFHPDDVRTWFEQAKFENVRLVKVTISI